MTSTLATTQAQREINAAMVRTLAGRKATLFCTINNDTVYTGMRLLIDESSKIATLNNGAIAFQYAEQFTKKSAIVIEFQTFQYGKAQTFENGVVALSSRMVERKSTVYFVAINADKSTAWFKKSKGEYIPTTPILALGEHFTTQGNLFSLVTVWLTALDKNKTSDLDKRAGIVNGKLTDYGAYLYEQGKTDASMKLKLEALPAMAKAYNTPKTPIVNAILADVTMTTDAPKLPEIELARKPRN